MHVNVNGQDHEIAEGLTITDLIASMQLQPAATAVEYNEAVLARDMYQSTLLKNGDRIELVRFVGGG